MHPGSDSGVFFCCRRWISLIYWRKGDDCVSTTKKEKCFIITPIGEDNAPIRRHIDGIIDAAIIPALSDKYDIQAAHHISKPGSITKQVIEAIYNAKLVIANLSERNPNVMYELALRHAIGKPVIMIVERGTPVPSDIIMQRTVLYDNDAKGVLELQAALKKAEAEIDFKSKGGPIFDVLGDITRDTNMLKEAAESKAGSQEPLAYIMQRLDRIESSLNRQDTAERKNAPSDIFTLSFSFAPVDDPVLQDKAETKIVDSLVKRGCYVFEMFTSNKEISVSYRNRTDLTRTRTAQVLCKELESLGLTNVSFSFNK